MISTACDEAVTRALKVQSLTSRKPRVTFQGTPEDLETQVQDLKLYRESSQSSQTSSIPDEVDLTNGEEESSSGSSSSG